MLTYNEKFGRTAEEFPLGEVSLAEYELPDADFECTRFLCAEHAKSEPNFDIATHIDQADKCDLMCDACRNAWLAHNP